LAHAASGDYRCAVLAVRAPRLLLLPAIFVAACALPPPARSPARVPEGAAAPAAPAPLRAPLAPAEEDRAEPARAQAPLPSPERAPWPPAPPGIETSYCLSGVMEALAEDACYVLPDQPTTTLLIYLPGLMPNRPDSPEKRGVETVVAKASRRAGVAALVPRGPTRDELAAPGRDPKGLGDHRSWPTSDGAYRQHALALVERINAKRRALEALAGAPFERVYLGGSSAGAYFVGHLALRGDFPADGYLVLSGGSARPAKGLSEREKGRLYVGYGDGDIVGPKANEVARQARSAGWEVMVAMHHTGHGSREVYLDEAFAFFGVTPR
jgi:predicted esterase